MFLVSLTCSDQDCTEEIEVVVNHLTELDGLVCECGYGTVTISIGTVELV